MNIRRAKIIVMNLLNDKKFKVCMGLVNGISETMIAVHSNLGTLNVLKVASSNLLKLNENFMASSWDYFDFGWTELFDSELSDLVRTIIEKYPHDDIKGVDSECVARIHTLKGYKIGYLKYADRHRDDCSTVYVKEGELETVKALICNEIWSLFGGKHVVLTRKVNSERVVFRVDESIKNLDSEFATRKIAHLKKCIDVNLPRSVLLYGKPGTGKSTIAKTIIRTLGLRSFRINLQDLNRNICGTLVDDAIKIFKPEALIIDDIDRANRQDELLAAIEMFHDQFKIVIVTANNLDRFDQAMLRPERFDEIDCINFLDENVIKQLLGESNMDMFEQVKTWPISFINEAKNSRRVNSPEEMVETMKQLSFRVGQLEGDYEEETSVNATSQMQVDDFDHTSPGGIGDFSN